MQRAASVKSKIEMEDSCAERPTDDDSSHGQGDDGVQGSRSVLPSGLAVHINVGAVANLTTQLIWQRERGQSSLYRSVGARLIAADAPIHQLGSNPATPSGQVEEAWEPRPKIFDSEETLPPTWTTLNFV